MATSQQVESLMIAVLAVSAWPPAKVIAALPAMRAAGLTDPSRVARMDLGELTVLLARNGYHRGLPTSLYGERLHALMRCIDAGEVDSVLELVPRGARDEFLQRIQGFFGIGPAVARSAWELLRAQPDRSA